LARERRTEEQPNSASIVVADYVAQSTDQGVIIAVPIDVAAGCSPIAKRVADSGALCSPWTYLSCCDLEGRSHLEVRPQPVRFTWNSSEIPRSTLQCPILRIAEQQIEPTVAVEICAG
jgi:hypothetical protein